MSDFDDIEPPEAPAYDPAHGDDRVCECGHVYYRHFDPFEKMEPVGCKYCHCFQWKPMPEGRSDELIKVIGRANSHGGIMTDGTAVLSGYAGQPVKHVLLTETQWDKIKRVLDALGITYHEFDPEG